MNHPKPCGINETVPTRRCAIYTRKSSQEGLEKEFNSLDAQRQLCEAYIQSQLHLGWQCAPEAYDDGGFSGGTAERPALRRLLADIEAGRIDVVVVYKVDRLSRSLLDFARMMDTFEEHSVSFVSVTQQFNTATSMGRLVLHILLSFAQFEREIISERTRDKVAAARRKGKWSGGKPVLGYDLDSSIGKLIVNHAEAERVRDIFQLYLEHESLLRVVQELERRGWTNKRWTTRKRVALGGKAFTRTSLYQLLTNVVYTGKVRHKSDVYEGEHEAIVDADLWHGVQTILERNGRTGGGMVRNKFGAILKGLVFCVPCDSCMTHSHSRKGGTKRYRYYVCSNAQKKGWDHCPSKSIPAGEVERIVLERIRAIATDPTSLSSPKEGRGSPEQVPAYVSQTVKKIAHTAWESLTPREQVCVIRLLVERVDYDGLLGRVSLRLHAGAMRALAQELSTVGKELA